MKKIYKLLVVAILISSAIINAQSAGTLTFKLGEVAHASTYSGTKRCLAIWIEQNTTGSAWVFTKSLLVKGINTPNNHIPTWNTASASNTTGVVASTSTLTWTSGVLQTVTWDGKNVAGALVSDGNYRVAVEETWQHGGSGTAVAYFPFTKGAAADSQTPTNVNFTGLNLSWAPTLASDTFSKGPEAMVYPIPSKGIFNIDIKSDVKNIQVVDINGKVIYNEIMENASSSSSLTKKVDLSSFNDGIYFINVSDGNNTSSFKVALEK